MLGLVLLFIFTLGFFYLFVCIDPNTKGFLGAMRFFFLVYFPNKLKRVGITIFGLKFVNVVEKICRYICYERNPLVQLFYLGFIIPSFYFWYWHGFVDMCPGKMLDEIHLYMILLCYVSCLMIFVIASNSNPGLITAMTWEKYHKRAQYNEILYKPDAEDPITGKPRVPRSKYCATCNHVVAKFDHHCIWINNDVGENNYRWFVLFLMLHSIFASYGTSLSIMAFL